MFALRPARLSFLFSPQALLFSGKFPSRTLVPVHNNSIRSPWDTETVTQSLGCLRKPAASLCSSAHSSLSPRHWPVSTTGFSFRLSWLLSFAVLVSNYNDKDDVKGGKVHKVKNGSPSPQGLPVSTVYIPTRHKEFCLLSHPLLEHILYILFSLALITEKYIINTLPCQQEHLSLSLVFKQLLSFQCIFTKCI